MGIREKTGWALACALALTVVAALAGAIGAGPLDPPGPPGETDGVRGPGTPVTALPVSISQPGRYYLTRDLASATGGITISALDVDLDLGGFTLAGPNSGRGIQVTAPAGARVRIHDGSIRNWEDGIEGIGAANVTVERVHVFSVQQNGIELGGKPVLRDCSVTSAGGRGILILTAAAVVERCSVKTASVTGITVGPGSVVTDCTVTGASFGVSLGAGSVLNRCLVNDNPNGGISASGSQVIDAVVIGNGGRGISMTGIAPALISGCTVRNTAASAVGPGIGIEVGANAIIDSCVVEGNADDGITGGSFNIVRNSVAGNNGGDGIVSGSGSLLEDNTVADNAGDGIRTSHGSRVLNNTLRFNMNAGNGAGVRLTGSGNWVEGSDLSSNDIGIASSAGGNTILNNTARNHTGGHYVLHATDLAGAIVNDANDGTNTGPHYNNTP